MNQLHEAEKKSLEERLYGVLENVLSRIEKEHRDILVSTGTDGRVRYAQAKKDRLELQREPDLASLSFVNSVCEARFVAKDGNIQLLYQVQPTYASEHIAWLLGLDDGFAHKLAEALAYENSANHCVGRVIKMNLASPRRKYEEKIYDFLNSLWSDDFGDRWRDWVK